MEVTYSPSTWKLSLDDMYALDRAALRETALEYDSSVGRSK